VLQDCLDLAVADEMVKRSPARSDVVTKPRAGLGGKVQPWTDAQVAAVTDAHPQRLRALLVLMTGCGLRIAEALALALEDFDFDERILHVRRQIKKLGADHIFGLPKNDLERDVPLPDWAAAAVRVHGAAFEPRPCKLPWEKLAGKPRTNNLLFRWSDGRHVRYRTYSEQVWKPALASAGIIPAEERDARGRARYKTTHKEGPHQLRHYYATVVLHGGVSVKEFAEYLGHHDPAFTLRVYSHLIPGSHERAAGARQPSVPSARCRRRNIDGTGAAMAIIACGASARLLASGAVWPSPCAGSGWSPRRSA
jgi:integrase